MAFFLFWEGVSLFPLTESDALWFLPAPIQFAGGTSLLVNHLHYQAIKFDPTGADRAVFYPPGLPWLLGVLTPEPTPRGVCRTLAVLCAGAVLLTGMLYDEQVRRRQAQEAGDEAGPKPGFGYGTGMLGIVALGTYFQGMAFGRPDFPATLFALFGWWVLDGMRGWERWVWAGLVLGAMAFTQTVTAFFACALLGIACALRGRLRDVAAQTLPAYALATAFLAVLFGLSPNGLVPSMQGIVRHASATMIEGNEAPFMKYFLFHSYASGYGLLFLAALGFSVWAIAASWRRGEVGSRTALAAFALALLVMFDHFVAHTWNRLYNVWTFSPFLLLLIQNYGSEALRRAGDPRVRRLLFGGVAAVLGIASLGFLHNAALFALYRMDAPGRFFAARAKATELLMERPPGPIGVSKSLWVFFNDYRGVRSFVDDPGELARPPRYLFVQQRYTDYRTAPEFPGYRRVWDDFRPGPARLAGIVLSPTWPSYRFAFYERPDWVTAPLPPAAAW